METKVAREGKVIDGGHQRNQSIKRKLLTYRRGRPRAEEGGKGNLSGKFDRRRAW